MVSSTTLQTNMAATRTVIVEVKYINSKNVVIHSENCKVEIPLDITAQQLSKKNCRINWHLPSDILAASSNSQMAIYLVTTNFDGVGILGTITLTIEYLEGWNDVTSLALSGDNLAMCVDGKI